MGVEPHFSDYETPWAIAYVNRNIGMTDSFLAKHSHKIVEKLKKKIPNKKERGLVQALVLAEEAGEVLTEYRLVENYGRQIGSWAKVEEELADVVIAAYVFAHLHNIDLDHAIWDKIEIIEERGGL